MRFVLFPTHVFSNNLVLLVLSRSLTTSLQPPPYTHTHKLTYTHTHIHTHTHIFKPKTILKISYINALPCGLCLDLFSSNLVLRHLKVLKVHKCRYQNLSISSSSHKNNMSNVSHCNTVYFLRYMHPRYMKF